MSLTGELSTAPISPETLVQQATVLALRQVTDTLAQQGRTMERLAAKVEETNEQFALMRGARYDARLEAIETQIDALRSAQDRRNGVANFVEYLSKVGPWILACAAAMIALIHNGGKAP